MTEDLGACVLDVRSKHQDDTAAWEAYKWIVEALCDTLDVIVARSRMVWHLWLRIG